jgi:hypothetical protein
VHVVAIIALRPALFSIRRLGRRVQQGSDAELSVAALALG